jgi:hypothetical protein
MIAAACAAALLASGAPLAQEAAPTAPTGGAALIDFELSDVSRFPGAILGERYRSNFGVSFGSGAHVVRCGSTSEAEVRAANQFPPCAHPNAASGLHAGYFDGTRDALVITLDRPARSVSLRINLPFVFRGQSYEVSMFGDAGQGESAASRLTASGDAASGASWPTTAEISVEQGGMTRVMVMVAYDGPGQFLFDDLTISYGGGAPPVMADIARPGAATLQAEGPPQADPAASRVLRVYDAPLRVRARIDWAAAEAAVAEQARRGIAPVGLADRSGLDRALLPVLLPTAADPASADVSSTGDTFYASYARAGREYSVYGSRILARMAGSEPASAANFEVMELDYGLGASFAVYGAAYRIVRYCTRAEIEQEGRCHDPSAIAAEARDLAVAIGAAGGGRP